jgi:hypothetical protein
MSFVLGVVVNPFVDTDRRLKEEMVELVKQMGTEIGELSPELHDKLREIVFIKEDETSLTSNVEDRWTSQFQRVQQGRMALVQVELLLFFHRVHPSCVRQLNDLLSRFAEYVDAHWQQCEACGTRTGLRICTSCGLVYYCSRRCQKKDWQTHKQTICRFVLRGIERELEKDRDSGVTLDEMLRLSGFNEKLVPRAVCINADALQNEATVLWLKENHTDRGGHSLLSSFHINEWMSLAVAIVQSGNLIQAAYSRLRPSEDHHPEVECDFENLQVVPCTGPVRDRRKRDMKVTVNPKTVDDFTVV